MSIFNEQDHPRGGDGRFRDKPQQSAGMSLPPVEFNDTVSDAAQYLRAATGRSAEIEYEDFAHGERGFCVTSAVAEGEFRLTGPVPAGDVFEQPWTRLMLTYPTDTEPGFDENMVGVPVQRASDVHGCVATLREMAQVQERLNVTLNLPLREDVARYFEKRQSSRHPGEALHFRVIDEPSCIEAIMDGKTLAKLRFRNDESGTLRLIGADVRTELGNMQITDRPNLDTVCSQLEQLCSYQLDSTFDSDPRKFETRMVAAIRPHSDRA